jgi:membrane complex biogenesis BtpA family protein
VTSAADIFGREKALIGMVHIAALPGTPRHGSTVGEITALAVEEARLLADVGFDALIIENMHDLPYLRREVGPEIVAGMTAAGAAVRRAVGVPLGVQILAGANHASLAVAHAVGAQFIRAEGYVFASVADEGIMEEADAGPLLRYRRSIGADAVQILADVNKKHSAHAITADVDVGEMARTAEICGADGVVVTGLATGRPIRIDDLGTVRVATTLPILVGSGVGPEAVKDLFAYADGVIVGSWYKADGHWANPIDRDRARELVLAIRAARGAGD